jgi:hypothetical protein
LFKVKYLPNGIRNNTPRCLPQPVPLSKISGLNTQTNNTQISNRMRYSQLVKNNGTTQYSSSSLNIRKPNSLGGAVFSY